MPYRGDPEIIEGRGIPGDLKRPLEATDGVGHTTLLHQDQPRLFCASAWVGFSAMARRYASAAASSRPCAFSTTPRLFVRFRMIRFDRERLLISRLRILQPAHVLVGIAEIGAGFEIARIELDRLVVGLDASAGRPARCSTTP